MESGRRGRETMKIRIERGIKSESREMRLTSCISYQGSVPKMVYHRGSAGRERKRKRLHFLKRRIPR